MKKSVVFILSLFFCSWFCSAEKIVFPVNAEETGLTEPVNITVDWDEKVFGSVPSSVYNHNIARVACILSDVSYVNIKTDPDLKQAKDVYKVLGVSPDKMEFHYDIDYNAAGFGRNQSAFSFASKQITAGSSKKTLVFVTIRGTPQDASEWISNINVGDSVRAATKIHEGFFNTENQVHSALIYYLLRNKISPDESFFLITGHSRGAAVANLLGANLLKTGYFKKENLYVYTFASPNVSTEEDVFSEKYDFIWNIVNPEDIVPTVPMRYKKWDYKKYGNVKVFANRWNTSREVFEENYLPKISKYYNMFMKRDYCPFYLDSFVPNIISRVVAGFYPDVNHYYHAGLSLRTIAEKIFNKIFDKDPAKEEKGLPAIITNLKKTINKKTKGLADYSELAFADMHICTTYLSWMMALEEDEIYSETGSSRILISNACEAAVYDHQGNIVLKILDGLPVIESIELPVIACPLFSGTLIGLPSSEDYTVVIYKDSLLPTPIPVTIEHYTAEGYLTDTGVKHKIWPHKGIAYIFEAGKVTLTQNQIDASKNDNKMASILVKESRIRQRNVFRIQPEASWTTDLGGEVGCRFGSRSLHLSVLTDQSFVHFGNLFDLNTGIGHEFDLCGQALFGVDVFAKCAWATGRLEEGDTFFNFVPGFRLTLSYKPFRRAEFFVSGNFDFHIARLNDAAFRSGVRKAVIEPINFKDGMKIYPTILFGFRY